MTEIENLTLREFVKKNLRKGYIQPLQLLAGYLVLFIPKKKWKVKNIHQLQAAKQHYKKGLIPITINLRNLRQNR